MSAPGASSVVHITGGRPLCGTVRIGASKNASLPLLAAALLTREPVQLQNVAQVADTHVMRDILVQLGVGLEWRKSSATITAADIASDVPGELARQMRASVVLLGPLVARAGAAKLPKPGGDQIGARRVEMHVRGLRAMGAEVIETDGELVARAPNGLHGARVVMDMPTVTGTENILMAATLAEGRTEIYNAAREPHVQDLCRLLESMGADIHGAGTDEIVVRGVESLRGASHRVIADYLEAGTYAIAVAATGGDVLMEEAPAQDLASVMVKLQECGAGVETGDGGLRVRRLAGRPPQPVDLWTWAHPGFPTDLQAPYTALMTQASGVSLITEPIYDNRFQHVPDLTRMGARITLQGRDAEVKGPARLHGTDVTVPDIRSGAALVIAALCARGTTEIGDFWHIERGYEDMLGKLRALGADVGRPALRAAAL